MSESAPKPRTGASQGRSTAAKFAVASACLAAALLLWRTLGVQPPAVDAAAGVSHVAALAAPAAANPPAAAAPSAPGRAPALAAQQASMAASIQVIVGRNDTMDRIFRRMALDTSDLARIRDLPGIRQSLDFLRPGDSIQVTHAAGAIRSLTRRISETQTLKVVREPTGFAARMIENPVEIRTRAATAAIDSSLFQSAEKAQISESTALALANIFAWDIDFVLDIRDGDTFTVVYQQIFQDGKYLRDGDILAAEFVNAGKPYRALRFVDADGHANFFSPDGLPMRKAFLRAPVEFTRISSRFNPHRHHPILNLIRGHMGTDYAAPIGTPVRAASDGRVSFKGRRGGYGNAVMIAHSRGISTLYGHLSRYARNLRVGGTVRQGEVIAYVGMTGLATGPHLHYEYLMNGVHKDPEKVQPPAAGPLQGAELARFTAVSAPILARLDNPNPAASSANHRPPLAAN